MNEAFKTLAYIINGFLYLVIIALWLSISDELWLCLSATIINLIFTIGLIIWDRARLQTFYTSNYFKSFVQVVISAVLLFCIIGLLNYLAYKNPTHFDISYGQRNSLTNQTVQVLDSLDEEVVFDIYAKKQNFGVIRSLVELYRFEKNDININFIDVELRPDLVLKANVSRSESIVVSFRGRSEIVEELSELGLTSALVRLSRDLNPRIAFIHGIGGHELTSENEEGLSHLVKLLELSNFDIARLNILSIDEIPSDVDVLVLWGASITLSQDDVQKINNFVTQGGSVLVGLGPDFNSDKQPYLRSSLLKFGIEIRNDLVIDQLKHISGSSGTVPMIDSFRGFSPIIKELDGIVFFPLTSSVLPNFETIIPELAESADIQPALFTSPFPASWGEQDLNEVIEGNPSYTEGVDLKGPISLAVSVEYESEENNQRIVVFGNSSFVLNSYQRFDNNFQLFLNTISWLAREDRLMSLNVPTLSNNPVFVSAPQLGIIFYFSVVFAPLGLFGLAILVYRRRSA